MPLTPPIEFSSAAVKRLLARRLLAWYRRHRRDLPWRRTRDPYPIWVSEIMLQQTQVATVVPYFERFVAAMPTIGALAAADESEVLRLWEGLGYYRRARQLHRAAREIVERHAGRFPNNFASARELPGIGRYTAGAILSIAFDAPTPILEANTVRLFSRLVAFEGDTAGAAGQQVLWKAAEDVLPARHCGEFNQALMELGSQLCTPQSPDCDCCPLAEWCQARALGRQSEIPAVRSRPATEAVREADVVVWHKRRLLIRQRAAGERWAGLWDFLRFPLVARGAKARTREVIDKVQEHSGLAIGAPRHLATIKHGVTRFRITLDCYAADCESQPARLAEGTWRWVRASELQDLPLSVTGRKLSRMLCE